MRSIAAGTDGEFRTDGLAGLETDIEDVLANVRHLCDRFGLEYGDRDAAAYRAYLDDFEEGGPVVRRREAPTDPLAPTRQRVLRVVVDEGRRVAPQRAVRAGFVSIDEFEDLLGVDHDAAIEIAAQLAEGVP